MPRPIAWVLAVCLLLAGGLEGAAAKRPKDSKPGVPDKALQKAIDKAIANGAQWLRAEQKQNGAWDGLLPRGKQTAHHELGTTALAGLALLAAGDERGDPEVDKAYRYLREKDRLFGRSGVRQTYDAGVLLMFVTHYWRGSDEGPRGRRGKDRKDPCGIPDDDAASDPDGRSTRDWVLDIVRWLTDVRYKKTATWGYPAHREDLSNTQYAFLGLRAARDCGLHKKIPSKVFLDAATTILERQEKDGPRVKDKLPEATDGHVYAFEGDRARGWSYLMEPYVPTGSMTTAGIAILAICNDALLRPRRFKSYTRKMEYQVQRAAQDGFAWLALNWAVDRNPGSGSHNWHYYYLYGLERAAILGGRDLVGPHDWYIEGAKYLIGEQASDGHWSTGMLGAKDYEASDLCDTAWAVLFLARATRPAPPLRPPPVTPGD